MSIYEVQKLCWRIRKDAALLEELRRDARTVLERFRLSRRERDALVAGDVAALEQAGAHGYLLANLGRFGCFGRDRASYVRRIKRG